MCELSPCCLISNMATFNTFLSPLQAILRIVDNEWRSFDAVNIATALHLLGSCRLNANQIRYSVIEKAEVWFSALLNPERCRV